MTKINKMYVVHYEFVQIAAGMVNNDLSTLINETEKPCVFRVIKRKKEKKTLRMKIVCCRGITVQAHENRRRRRRSIMAVGHGVISFFSHLETTLGPTSFHFRKTR